MPKNVLFSLKNCKNRHTLEALPPEPLASGGWGLHPQTPTSVILHCKFFLSALAHTLRFFWNDQKGLVICSCNYSGSAPGFRRKKNYAVFLMLKTAKIIIIGFNFFCFVLPTHFVLAPPLDAGVSF